VNPFLRVYFLFEVFGFKTVWNERDNISRCRNGHLKWKELYTSVVTLRYNFVIRETADGLSDVESLADIHIFALNFI
jgi:hypothetical protein